MKKFIISFFGLTMSFLMIFQAGSYAVRYSIDVKDFEFSPSGILTVKIGDTIHWEWKSGAHTTTSTTIPAGASSWDKPMDISHLTFDYIPATVGVYHYKCTPHESMGMVGQFTVVSTAGIGENVMPSKFTIYPNPVRNKVNFNATLPDGVFIQQLIIYDILGKKIREILFNERGTFAGSLDLSDVHGGILFFEFTDNFNRSYILQAVRKD
jgi:plastocyanin